MCVAVTLIDSTFCLETGPLRLLPHEGCWTQSLAGSELQTHPCEPGLQGPSPLRTGTGTYFSSLLVHAPDAVANY